MASGRAYKTGERVVAKSNIMGGGSIKVPKGTPGTVKRNSPRGSTHVCVKFRGIGNHFSIVPKRQVQP